MSDKPVKPQGDNDTGRHGDTDRQMLETLVCPLTQTVLEYDAARQELVSKPARLAFPIRNGIPIMLVDEARKLG